MRNKKLQLLPLVIAMIFLTNCGAKISEPAAALPVPVKYSDAFQEKLANELQRLQRNEFQAIEAALIDYSRLRKELRARPR